ncbi:MAG: T9SS type A sorting domain-containing protein [Flavobacteriales bacterium]|nr:T9SS type A sorting domain-containing protein [Flavobacteriales bacterium]MCC6939630.1 T9SS type A sorting domain-containing protein [Flavobacteriales bacterium]
MKSFLLAPLLLLSALAHAQLFNGSFEQAGSPSLAGWEWTCEDPGIVNEGAPNSGEWSVTKQPGNAKGCFPNFLFQRLSDVQPGQMRTLTGWVRCLSTFNCPGAHIGFGRIQNGTVATEETVFSVASDWTFLTITDTIEFSAGDTALVVLNGGFVGGPVFPPAANFDGIELLAPQGVSSVPGTPISQRWDALSRTLYLGSATPFQGSVMLFDATGRILPAIVRRVSPTNLQIDAGATTSGIYFVHVVNAEGERAVRFVVP